MQDANQTEDNSNTTRFGKLRKSRYFLPLIICLGVWKIASTYYGFNYAHKIWNKFSTPRYSRVLIECRKNLRDPLGNNSVSRAHFNLEQLDLD